MHWNDFLHPERVAGAVLKLFAVALVLVIVGSELVRAFACVTLPRGMSLWMLPGLALVSIVAYLVREHRMRQSARPRNTRGAERTPLLPRMEDEE